MKNPFMSAWLSAAHSSVNRASGTTRAAMQRTARKVTHAAAEQVMQNWLDAVWGNATPSTTSRRPRKARCLP